jgi:formylmethanofuran dehydrogenase subunit E
MRLTNRVLIQGWKTDADGKRIFHWIEVDVIEALRKSEKHGRCIECNEPFEGSELFAADPEHRKRNPKCSLSDVRREDR